MAYANHEQPKRVDRQGWTEPTKAVCGDLIASATRRATTDPVSWEYFRLRTRGTKVSSVDCPDRASSSTVLFKSGIPKGYFSTKADKNTTKLRKCLFSFAVQKKE